MILKVMHMAVLAACAIAPVGAQAQVVPEPVDPALHAAATAALPDLAVAPRPGDADNYDKYYYFHRDGTDVAEAWADISECDALASGISYRANGGPLSTGYYASQYGIGGVVGGVVGSIAADMIYGSAKRRAIRRVNMRNCMGFKGYDRYGLSKDVWERFNFEEGNGRKEDRERNLALMQQAIVASGPKPQAGALGI